MLEKIKEMVSKDKSKKFTSNLIILLCLGVLIVIMSNVFFSNDEKDNFSLSTGETVQDKYTSIEDNLFEDYSSTIESKLKNILGQIKGVGKVNVMITLEDTAERIPAFNTTQMNEKTDEKDAQGGAREVVREDLTQQVVTGSGNESLMIIKEVKPKVRGVVVVAEGAENIEVKEKLYSAVKTVLGISGNKVEIYSSN
ncbi:stage III sporulation protein AG [Brassicibacter mesophilus]|uniref:stage III sporulation protein AG n=1 Tax=Brassicibacter mesophilus TaxID=745119 RepID=UPI003D19E70E